MPNQLPTIRIFISSPSDVRPERLKAEQIIARLDREFAYRFHVQAVLWERAPLLATHHFQDERNIPRPRRADIVVVILWSQLGVPLPADRFHGAISGRSPVTGTEWEFEDALSGARETGVPDLLLYRKQTRPTAELQDRKALEERLVQLDLVEDFIGRWFRSEDGTGYIAASHSFADAAAFEEQLYTHLRELLERRAGAHVEHVAIRWHQPPFRGLLSFDYEHAPVFFGRTRARNELRELLARRAALGCAFVLVLGASGSGKSSLVKAGLLPDLILPGMIGRVALVRWALLRPSNAPADLLGGLAAALLDDTGLPELAALHYPQGELSALLREAPGRATPPLRQALGEASEKARLADHAEARVAIIVDQFEELFTLDGVDAAAREAFVAALDALARSGLVWIIATMRSDFYDRIETFPSLAGLATDEACYRVLPPNDAELGQIIRQPALEAGLSFEIDPHSGIGLDETICQEAARNPAALPLLSFLLDQLWQRRDTRSGMLSFSAYRALGGFEGALGTRAEEVFQALPNEVQASFPQVLRTLVTITDDAAKPTARLVPLSSFPDSTDAGRLARAFLAPEARLLVADSDGDAGVIRIAHEAIISSWPRARDEVAASWQDLQRRARVETATLLWLNEGRPEARLLSSGLPLSEAIDLLDHDRDAIDQGVIDFIEASVSLHKARLQERLLRREEIARVAALDDLRGLQRRRFSLRAPGRIGALILLVIALIVRGLDPAPVQEIRARTFDMAQRLWPRAEADDSVEIVAIDEKSLAAKGQWPWPRTLIAELVRRIAAGRPVVLGIDISFTEPNRYSPQGIAEAFPGLPAEATAALDSLPDGDALLGEAIGTVPTVLVADPTDEKVPRPTGVVLIPTPVREQGNDPRPFLLRYASLIRPLPAIARRERGEGATSFEFDLDGIARRLPLVVVAEDRLVPAFAVAVVGVAQRQASAVIATGAHGVEHVAAGVAVAPTDARGEAILHFAPSSPYFAASDVLGPKFDTGQFTGHVVLLGVIGAGLVDRKQTPLGLMAGVQLNAQLIQSILEGSLLQRPPIVPWIELAIILLVGLVPIFLLSYEAPALTAGITLALVPLLLAGELALFRLAGFMIDGVFPALTAILTFVAMLGGNVYAAERAKRRAETSITRVVNAFDEYMSDT
jgi:CHASE2 domain-containing sensor protein